MNMIKFHDLTVNASDLISPSGRRVAHQWGRSWTRIEVAIPDMWESPGKISAWIEQNLSGGRFGLFYTEDKDRPTNPSHTWDRNYKLIIGFEVEDDALMFKLLDGHVAHHEDEPF